MRSKGTQNGFVHAENQQIVFLLCLLESNSDFLEQMHAGVVWPYNLVWMIVQDVVKLCIYWELNARAANQTPFLKDLKAVVHPHGALHQH